MSIQVLRRWLFGPVEHTLLQAPRAFVASLVTAVLDVLLMAALVEMGGWPPLLAATVSYLTGGVFQYYISSWWVFPTGRPKSAAQGFLAFTLLSLVGLALTWAVMAVLGGLGVNYAAAKVAALGVSFTWNFLSRKYLVFARKRPAVVVEPCPVGV